MAPEKALGRDNSLLPFRRTLCILPRILLWTLGVFLCACLALFVFGTWKWPLVGDASVIHYVAFLMAHGFAPYRQIIEMNMPGCYLVEWVVIHTFGGGSLSWRLFDLFLLAVSGAAMIVIAKPYSWFAGFAAAALLALVHGQDGVAFLGERDLIIAALLAWAYAFLFLSLRRNAISMLFASGVAAGIAATMKPLAIPVGLVLLALLALRLKNLRRPCLRPLLYSGVGFLLPCLIVYIYLLQVHAVGAFVATMLGLARYYNGLYRKPLGFLLLHSVSPIGPLVALWLVVIAVQRQWNWEQWMLAGGALLGLIFYCAQGRGFPYYRYPLLLFLLLLMGIDFAAALRRPILRYFSAAGIAYGLLFLAPHCAFKAVHYDWRNQEFITLLNGDLQTLGGRRLSGKVQCFDTTAGCVNTLYRARLVQATGFLYDCYAYAPRGEESMWVVNRYRRAFLRALTESAPEVLVVSDQYCQGGQDGYDKLKRWPALNELIGSRYRLYAERMPPDDVYWWSRPLKPSGYRIYLRK